MPILELELGNRCGVLFFVHDMFTALELGCVCVESKMYCISCI